jgi:hypothetical protein
MYWRLFCRRTGHESLANAGATTRRRVIREWCSERQVSHHCAATIELRSAFVAAFDVGHDCVSFCFVEQIERKRVEIGECFVVIHG